MQGNALHKKIETPAKKEINYQLIAKG